MPSRSIDAVDAATRMLKLALRLFRGDCVDARFIREEFRVSWPTAKRDMTKIEQCLPVQCELVDTTNGALPPMRRFHLPKWVRENK